MRPPARMYVFALAAALLCGCAENSGGASEPLMYRANAQRTGVFASAPLEELSEVLWKFKAEPTSFSFALSDGLLYFGADTLFYAVEAASGQERWRFEVEGGVLFSSPAVAEGRVYFGTIAGRIYALDALTGRQRWHRDVEAAREDEGAPVYSSPVVAGGVLYVASLADLYALDAETGQEKWCFRYKDFEKERPEEGKFFEGMLASPVVVGETVFASTLEGHLLALHALTGQEKWRRRRSEGFFSTLATADDVLFADAAEGRAIYAFSALTGQEKWRFEAGADIGGGLRSGRDGLPLGQGCALRRKRAHRPRAVALRGAWAAFGAGCGGGHGLLQRRQHALRPRYRDGACPMDLQNDRRAA